MSRIGRRLVLWKEWWELERGSVPDGDAGGRGRGLRNGGFVWRLGRAAVHRRIACKPLLCMNLPGSRRRGRWVRLAPALLAKCAPGGARRVQCVGKDDVVGGDEWRFGSSASNASEPRIGRGESARGLPVDRTSGVIDEKLQNRDHPCGTAPEGGGCEGSQLNENRGILLDRGVRGE